MFSFVFEYGNVCKWSWNKRKRKITWELVWVPCDQKAIFRTRLVKKLTLVSLLVLACVCFASYTSPEEKSEKRTSLWIQLFRERLSSKVHATIPQSNVGGFEFTVPQRNFKEGQEKAWTNVCECQRKMSKVGSTATVSGTVYWSYPILPFEIVTCTFFSDNHSRNSCIRFVRFWKREK